MVFRLEIKFRGGPDALYLKIVLVFFSPGCHGMGHVGNPYGFGRESGVQVQEPCLGLGDSVLEELPLLDFHVPRLRVELGLHRRGVLVPLFAIFLNLFEKANPLVEKGGYEIGVGGHISIGHILTNRGKVFFDESVVEHDWKIIYAAAMLYKMARRAS
ncbi:MAG: hypothetical protein FD137_998 [Spirochaetes bacterium]|nr:MAG: hypothetical protein FD137_998 [Spirochaetota bacterium]